MTVRVTVFPKWPEAILIFADSDTVILPVLHAPFVKADVAKALGDAGLRAHVREEHPGRWTTALERMASAERAERHSQTVLRAAGMAKIMATSVDDVERRRALLCEEKLQVDASLRDVKVRIARAKSVSYERGEYMAPAAFRALESEAAELGTRSLAIQNALSAIKLERKAADQKIERTRERLFVECAKRMLSKDQVKVLWEAVDAAELECEP